MKLVKVRRVGNSIVMTLPRGVERLGFTPGSQVLVEELPSGQLLVTPAEKFRTRLRKTGREVVAEDREALSILEAYDRLG
jgi:antitoxin component of MazEF toxin-antitoxin module